MAERKLRQVTWNIPADLYTRFQVLQKWARSVNFANIPDSEQDFAIIMFDDAVSRGEKVQRVYERSQKLILEPGDDRPSIFMPRT